MRFSFQSSYVANSLSVATLTFGLAIGGLTTQEAQAQSVRLPTPSCPPGEVCINGGGATFPEPLYASVGGWFEGLKQPGVQFTYISPPVGSGAGITAFINHTVQGLSVPAPPLGPVSLFTPYSFSGTDTPLTAAQATSAGNGGYGGTQGVIQVPVVLGSITIAYDPQNIVQNVVNVVNPSGGTTPVQGRSLTRQAYCGIFNGTITNWNQINAQTGAPIAVDPGAGAGDVPITIARRSDSSGTTLAFSTHLEAACNFGAGSPYNWERGVGSVSVTGEPPSPNPTGTTVYWPSNNVSAQGNQGVAGLIVASDQQGRVGYVENGTRIEFEGTNPSDISAAILQNSSGNFIDVTISPLSAATTAAFAGAADTEPAACRITVSVPDPTAANAYPIVAPTYMLFYGDYSPNGNLAAYPRRQQIVPAIRRAISNFPNQGFFSTAGDSIAIDKGYAPLPSSLKTASQTILNATPCITP